MLDVFNHKSEPLFEPKNVVMKCFEVFKDLKQSYRNLLCKTLGGRGY